MSMKEDTGQDDADWDAGSDSEGVIVTFRGRAHAQRQSLIFRLPTEIRLRIFQECFRNAVVTIVALMRHNAPNVMAVNPNVIKPGLALMRVCRLIYPEAIEAFFNMYELDLTNGQHSEAASSLIDSLYSRVHLGIRNSRLARIKIFCGSISNDGDFSSWAERSQDRKQFATGVAMLAQLPSLQSVAISAGWDTHVNASPWDKRLALVLESVLRAEAKRLNKVKRVCLWMGWPLLEESVATKRHALSKNFRVHRIIYEEHRGGRKYRLLDEGSNGETIRARRSPCPYCHDAYKPWDGYAAPLVETAERSEA